MSYNFHTSINGNGRGIRQFGYLHLVNNVWYIDEVPLDKMLTPHNSQFVEFCLFVPDTYDYPIDDKILAYVNLLRKCGIPTLSSCEGHIEENKPHYPYVVCAEVPPLTLLPEGWIYENLYTPSNVWRVRPEVFPKFLSALKTEQDKIKAFASLHLHNVTKIAETA